jgi:hypothetical protein
MYSKIKYNKISFIDWAFPISMILAQYKIGGSFSSYGFFMILIYTIIRYIKKKRIFIHKPLLFFTYFVIFISFINMIRLDLSIEHFIKHMLFSILLVICLSVTSSSINFNSFYKSYKIVGIVAGSIMVFQFVRLFFFNIPAVPVIILPIAIEDLHYWGNLQGLRPSSLFTEPQAYCSFLAPLIIMTILQKELYLTFFLSITMFMSTSSLGIGLVFMILLIYRTLFKSKKSFTPILFLIILSYLFYNLDVFDFARNKIFSTDISNDIRLSRGFIIFSNFNFTDLIFGIDITTQSYVLKNLNYYWVTQHINNESEHLLGYLTTYSGVLVKYGIISFFIFNRLFYKLVKNEDKQFRIFLFIIIILSFSQTILFNYWFLFYYTIYLGLCNKQKYNKNYIILN